MPLTEFLRMVKAKPDAAPLKASTSDDPSYRPDTDCVELVWENGQVTTMQQQGQSSKPIRPPSSYNFPTHATPKQDDDSNFIRMSNGSKVNKLSTMDSMLDDFPMSISVPSCEMGLDQDNADIVPWLNYAVHDPLHTNNDYSSDFLREFSGVTMVDLPPEPRERKSSLASSKHGFSSPKPASEKHPFFLPFEQQHDVSKPGSSGVTVTTNTSSAPTSASGFTNFSCLYRPAEISRAHNLTANNSVRLESCDDDKRCALRNGALATSTANSAGVCEEESLPGKPTEKLQRSDQAGFQVDVTTKNGLEDQGHQHHGKAVVTKAEIGGEKNKEPAVAIATSSVCSGNSVERTSNDHGRDSLKRKAREHGESDGQSDDADEESMGARKGASPRTGGKRSRAAEVHNLSERRRRDRINEKMRALQELIPNCNKVDKASMLDEAIEYLKTLQLQVQMLSMGSGGMYMQPTMMVPTHPAPPPGMHPMGLGMGFGMNMLDPTTGTIKLMPFQGPPQFPVMGPGRGPGPGPAYHHMMPGLGLGLHPFAQPIQRPLKVPLAPAPPNVAPSCSSNPKDGIGPQPTMPGGSGSNRAAREKVQAVNTAASGTGTMPS